jgi:hypothetical protein
MPQPSTSATSSTPMAVSSGLIEETSATTTTNAVAISLEMLQKIAVFCAQILRETSESSTKLEDLERGHQTPNRKNEVAQAEKHPKSTSGESPNNIFKLDPAPEPIIVQDPTRRQMIEDIWNKVEPFPLQLLMNGITEDTAEDSITQPQDLGDASNTLEQCLAQYSTWKRAMEDNPNWHTVYIRSLEDRMQLSEESSKPHLMAYCWNFLSNFSPDDKLGSLLIGCYKRRLFSPVKNLDSPDTLPSMFTQILRLVECVILLNDIYTLYDFHDFSQFGLGTFIFYRVQNIITCRNSIEELLGLKISKLVQIIHLTYCNEPSEISLCRTGHFTSK